MDRRGISSASSDNTFHFKLIPSHLKVEHAFAKTIKPNTNYRLVIYKGTPSSIQASPKVMNWPNQSKPGSLVERSSSMVYLCPFPFPSIAPLEIYSSQLNCWNLVQMRLNPNLPISRSNQVTSFVNSRQMERFIQNKIFHLSKIYP